MELKAYAKVNLHLAVGAKRPDGFHPIASVVQTCSLADDIEINLSEGPFSVNVTGLEGICPKGESTLEKAANIWHERTGFEGKLDIRVKKNIPVQAGLGGGSSDAAVLIMYLNSLRPRSLDLTELTAISFAVGSDVPFFTFGRKTAVVQGRGETVTPIEPRTDLEGFIIVKENEKMSTAQAYAMLDSRAEIPVLQSSVELENIYRSPVADWTFRNDFELINTRPDVEVLEGERLFLTGSGSCWVLLSKREKLTLKAGLKAVKVSF